MLIAKKSNFNQTVKLGTQQSRNEPRLGEFPSNVGLLTMGSVSRNLASSQASFRPPIASSRMSFSQKVNEVPAMENLIKTSQSSALLDHLQNQLTTLATHD